MDSKEPAHFAYANDCEVTEQLGGNSESPVHSALKCLSADIGELHECFAVLERRLQFVCFSPMKTGEEPACPDAPRANSGLVCDLNEKSEAVRGLIKRAHKLIGALEI